MIKTITLNILNKITKNDTRLVKIIVNSIGSIASKGVNLIISIISVPLLLNYLGNERYGMFAMVASLMSFMTFSDLGLGLGLQNRIPEYKLNIDGNTLQRAISSTFFSLICVSLFLGIILALSNFFIDWARFYNVHSIVAMSEAMGVSWAFFICFLVNVPFNTVFSVLNGNQEAYLSELWRSVGNIICIILLIVAVKYKLSTPILILIMYGSMCIATITAFFYIFGKSRKYWIPKISLWDKTIVNLLFKDGIIYFILQIFAVGLTTVDSFLIAHEKGADSVATFMVGLRLISILSLPLTLINGQILPSLNDAIVKNENQWIKKILKKLLVSNTIYVLLIALILLFYGNFIVHTWVGNLIIINQSLWIGFIALFTFTVYNSLVSNILLTPKLLKYTLFVFPVSVGLMVFVKWWLISNLSLSVMLVGGSIFMFTIYILPALVKFKKLNFI